MTPQVSVIIPTYNRKDYLLEAVDSVLAQTFSASEIIVVDDGSTDGTGEALAARYASRICYVLQENQGVSVARNRGIALAGGEYVAFLDSDDVWLPEKLEKQLAVFAMYPRVAAVCGMALVVDQTSRPLATPPMGFGHPGGGFGMEQILMGGSPPWSTVMVRRACLTDVRFDPDIRFVEDWDFCLQLLAQYPLGYAPEPLALYRLHSRGWLQALGNLDGMLRGYLRTLDRFFALPGVSTSCLARIEPAARAARRAFAGFGYYAYGDAVRGVEELERACALAPETWADPSSFLRACSEFAVLLTDTGDEGRALGLARTVAARLPQTLAQRGISLSNLLGWTHMALAHRARQVGCWAAARRHVLQAMRTDPVWLRNRGALSLLRRSLWIHRGPSLALQRNLSDIPTAPWVIDVTLGNYGI